MGFTLLNYEKLKKWKDKDIRMHLNLSRDVEFILNQLNNNGNGFLVGGAVRDLISGKIPDDYDFATDIEYERLKEIFSDYSPKEVGTHFGILMIKVNGKSYEIARFRKESGVYNSRHPKEITFIGDIGEDLKRRDFTINSLAYNKESGIIDPFHGIGDMKRKLIRFVGNPKLRIEEDALRIMRGFRFVSKLGFNLERGTASAILEKRKFLNKISRERIYNELGQILLGNYVKKALIGMKNLGVLELIIPEFRYAYDFNQNNPKHKDNLFIHIINTVNLCEKDIITRFAGLFHDLGKIWTCTMDVKGISHYYGHNKESALIAEEKLRYLKASNETVDSVKNLVLHHTLIYENIPIKDFKKIIIGLGEKNLHRLFNLLEADLHSKLTGKKREEEFLIRKLKDTIEEIRRMGKIPDIREIDLTGVDLINLDFNPKEIREVKNDIYDHILDNKLENEKGKIIEYISEKYSLGSFKNEKSCGAVVYNPELNKFLIIKMKNGNWGFPKGHIEKDEADTETAYREVKEETGLSIKIMEGFKESIKYVPSPNILKEVIFFTGITEEMEVVADTTEIENFVWCTPNEAMQLITYKLQRDIMEKSVKFIEKYFGNHLFSH